MLMRGSQIVMECLLEQGVDTVFGYPGGTILNIYDEFELHGYKEKIRHYLTSHEQGASHAADGYARSTGKVGVCFATSGPGATNLAPARYWWTSLKTSPLLRGSTSICLSMSTPTMGGWLTCCAGPTGI